MLTEGSFTRDEWNHLLCLFNISHFSSAECSEVMSSSEEGVTAKSRPMMNLIARSNESGPSALSSTASESLVKTRHESQSPPSPQTEQHYRTVKDPLFAQKERTDPLYTHTYQATQNGMLIKLGLLKSGNLMN